MLAQCHADFEASSDFEAKLDSEAKLDFEAKFEAAAVDAVAVALSNIGCSTELTQPLHGVIGQ